MRKSIFIIAIALLMTTEMFADFSRDNEKEIVTDSTTGLMWQDNITTKTKRVNFTNAKNSCEALKLGGYDDWRVPSIEELQTIMDYSRFNPALQKEFVNFGFVYISSTHYGNFTDFLWSTSSMNGNVAGSYASDSSYYIRCVRSGSFGAVNSLSEFKRSGFTRDEKTKIVTDTKTNLQWQDDDAVKLTKKNWRDANRYCKELKLGGFDNWRLPSIQEMASIADYTYNYPALNGTFIHFTLERYWSSSARVFDEENAWVIGANTGIVNFHKKSDELGVRCIREEHPHDTLLFKHISPCPDNVDCETIAGIANENPTIMMVKSVKKNLEQTMPHERIRLEEVIKRGNEFMVSYYGGAVHEAAARWWYQRYNEDDGVPLGTVTDKTPWYGDDVAISGQRIHQILNFKSVMDGNLPSGCPNIHLARISENKNGIALRYEFLVVGTFYNQEERFNAEHHGEIWSIELSFNQENQLDDIRFLVGSDIQACKEGISQARFTLMGEEDEQRRPEWLTKERYMRLKKAVEEMQQASSICNSY